MENNETNTLQATVTNKIISHNKTPNLTGNKKRIHKIKETKSLCPECLTLIPATVYEKDGKVYMTKTCSMHREFTEIYWSDYKEYQRASSFDHIGTQIDNPRTKEMEGCPFDCGICPNHASITALGIIDVTNRCNLRCPICFAHAGAAGYVYEPTTKQIYEMMENLRNNSPIKTPVLQFSGGEPTTRENLPELISMAKELGFYLVMVDSNGIKMAEDVDYCSELRDAGLDNVYLQFDGVTPKPYLTARGFNLLPIKLKALQNLCDAGFKSTILVPVVVKGVNDDQIGDLINFAIDNRKLVRCINFQPVSITGRINREIRDEMRITIPELTKRAEEQTNGFLKQSDWYTIPSMKPFTEFLSLMKKKQFWDFSAHPHCGMGTYVIEKDGQVMPITSQVKVDETLQAFEKANENLKNGHKTIGKLRLAYNLIDDMEFSWLRNYLIDVIKDNDYESIYRMHQNMVFIGTMHFQDPYNFDIDRVRRCVIHYATPDGRIMPFCTMNNIHRPSVEKKYAKPLTEINLTPLYDVEKQVKRIQAEDDPYPSINVDHINPAYLRA